MQAVLLILATVFSMGSAPVWATIEEARFGLEEGTGQWRKRELEQWMEARLKEDIVRFVDESFFNVYVSVEFKSPRKSGRRIMDVKLGKFGTVAPIVVGAEPPRETMGLFSKIETVQVTMLVDNSVKQSAVDAMKTVVGNRIPMVDPKRVKLEVQRFDRPSLTFGMWMQEYKYVVGAVLCLLLIFGMLHLMFRKVRLQVQWSVGPQPARGVGAETPYPLLTPLEALLDDVNLVTAPSGDLSPKASLMPPPAYGRGLPVGQARMNAPQDESDENSEEVNEGRGDSQSYPMLSPLPVGASREATAPGHELKDSMLEQTLTALELRKIRAAFMALNFEDRKKILDLDIPLASIMLMVLPKDHVGRLMAGLNEATRVALAEENLKWNTQAVCDGSADIIAKIETFKSTDMRAFNTSVEQLATYVDQLSADTEGRVFDKLAQKSQWDLLGQVARHSPPAEVLAKLDFEIIKSAWLHLPIAKRAAVMRLAPDWLKKDFPKLKKAMGSDQLAAVMEEFDSLKKSEGNVDAKIKKALGEFVGYLRDAYRHNSSVQAQLEPHLEKWLFEKSNGLVGHADSKKRHTA